MSETDRFAHAIAMALLGISCIAGGDLVTKGLTDQVSLWQMLLLRSAMALAIMLPVLWLLGQWHRVRARHPRHLIVRSMAMSVSYLFFFAGVAALPMAIVAGAFFSAPFFVVLLGWLMLGERVGAWRIGSVAIGFAGVLLVLDPGGAPLDPAVLLPVLGAVSYAFTQVYTRKHCLGEDAWALSYWLACCFLLTGALGSAALELWPALRGAQFYNSGFQPIDLDIWGIFVVLGALSLITHYALAAAYQSAPAGFVGPLEYLYLPVVAVGGLWFYHEVPPPSAVLGIGVIISVGLVIIWREQRQQRLATAAAQA